MFHININRKTLLLAGFGLVALLGFAAITYGACGKGHGCGAARPCGQKALCTKSAPAEPAEMTAEEKAASVKVQAAGIGYLTAAQLSTMLRSGKPPVVIDVLSPKSYTGSRIKGAINIPYSKINAIAPTVLPDKSAQIVVYCANYQCGASLSAAKTLKALGYTNVHDYKGGLAEWTSKGLPLEGSNVASKQ